MAPFPGFPLASNKTNATPQTDDHPTHHNSLAVAVNDLQAQIDSIAASIPLSIIDAKGDLIAGTANNTVDRLPVGVNTSPLVADSNQGAGMAWLSASTPWTVSFGGAITLGNGTLVARFAQLGPLVLAQFKLLFGSTTTVDAAVVISPPVNMFDADFVGGVCIFIDASAGAAGRFSGRTRPVSVSTVALMTNGSPGSNVVATVPFTWAANDVLAVSLVYLAA